jgi:hypothetical protein
VMEACLREGIFPLAMEHLPARDADAIRVSVEMVDEADFYIGIFAWRYGHIPDGHDISITEMEFNRAVAIGLPVLVFVMDESHPITKSQVETGDLPQQKLAALKARASQQRGRALFKSSDDLRGLVIQALGAAVRAKAKGESKPEFHPPSVIPAAPARYVAHPYTLLQTTDVIGRRTELKLLTDWITRNSVVPKSTRVFCVVAIGGMGKSALTWKWFEEIAPNELPHLAGRMWWSFYESDAHYENFIIRALSYVARIPESSVRKLPLGHREELLLRLLDEQPFLLVLDGLERILLAYARMDAAQLSEDDLDSNTANPIGQEETARKDTREISGEKHRLRLCADPRAGAFLKRLTKVRASRVLIPAGFFRRNSRLGRQNRAPAVIIFR